MRQALDSWHGEPLRDVSQSRSHAGCSRAEAARSLVCATFRSSVRGLAPLVAAAAQHHGRFRRGPDDLLHSPAHPHSGGFAGGHRRPGERAHDHRDRIPDQPADRDARLLRRLHRRSMAARAGARCVRIRVQLVLAAAWAWPDVATLPARLPRLRGDSRTQWPTDTRSTVDVANK